MSITISDQMTKILNEYVDDVKTATNNSIDKVAKESVRKLKQSSSEFRRTGEYAKGWTLKKERGSGGIVSVTVHNKKYQLTHLLENGHVVRNGSGTYGRVNGVKHIKPVEEWAIKELPDEIKRELE